VADAPRPAADGDAVARLDPPGDARPEPLSADFARDVGHGRLRGDLTDVVEVGKRDHAGHPVGRIAVIFVDGRRVGNPANVVRSLRDRTDLAVERGVLVQPRLVRSRSDRTAWA